MSAHAELRRILPNLKYRAAVRRALRAAFDREGFVEIETPVRIQAPAAEEYIEAPRSGDWFLRTSPELQMKRLLAAGSGRIYQLAPCFRENETGRLHRTEFTMLEWYMPGDDYWALLDFTKRFLCETAHAVNGHGRVRYRDAEIDLDADWLILPVREAFRRYANCSADDAAREESLFELTLAECIEPNLPKDRPCVLVDYPVRFGAFAAPVETDPTLAKRWELYLGGLELCNTYDELTDPVEQRARFHSFHSTRRRLGYAEYPEPHAFLESLDAGLPAASGAAMGFDRLVMLLAGTDDIADVTFPLDS